MKRRLPEPASAWLRLALPALAYLTAHMALGRLPGPWGDASTILLLPAALWYARRDGEPRPRLRPVPALAGLLAGVALGWGTGLLPLRGGASSPTGAPGMLALCLTGPLCEEAVYRAVALRRGRALMPPWAALAVSSALFAAGHGAPAQMAAAFAAGLVFGLFYLWGDNACPGAGFTAAVLCHMAANAALFFKG